MDPASAVPDEQLSPSSLAYLFASRFVVAAKPGSVGMRSFATGVTVNTEVLAVHLPVIALWWLHNSGNISLRPYEGRRSQALRWVMNGGGSNLRAVLLRPEPYGGLEGRVLGYLGRTKKRSDSGEDVYSMLTSLLPESKHPYEAVIEVVLKEVTDKGYVTRVSRDPGVGGSLVRRPKWVYESNPERYAPLAARVDELASEWKTFGNELYKSLRESSKRAIDSNKKDDLMDKLIDQV